MRGGDIQQSAMFSYLSPEQRVPTDHPLRAIRQICDKILVELSGLFATMYSEIGRPSVPPEKLLRALLLQVLYTVAGLPVTSELTSFESTNYQATQKRTEEFPVGSHHRVRYDPSNPAQARIGAGWNRNYFALPLIVVTMGALFALIGAVLLAIAKTIG